MDFSELWVGLITRKYLGNMVMLLILCSYDILLHSTKEDTGQITS